MRITNAAGILENVPQFSIGSTLEQNGNSYRILAVEPTPEPWDFVYTVRVSCAVETYAGWSFKSHTSEFTEWDLEYLQERADEENEPTESEIEDLLSAE